MCLGQLPFPEQEIFTSRTFVALPEEEKQERLPRSTSCPPRVRVPVTVMLRNLPNRAPAKLIEAHLTALGVADFTLHVPIDPRTGVNKGYGFVRLAEAEAAAGFCEKVAQTRLSQSSSKSLVATLAQDQQASLTRKKRVPLTAPAYRKLGRA